MANWTKKLDKVAKDDLEAGEQLKAAIFLQPSGTTGRMVGFGVGGVVGGLVADKMAGGVTELATDQGIAASLPSTPTVLGVTDRRVLVYGHSSLSGKPKGLKLAMPAGDLVAVEAEQRTATYRFVLQFADGTGREFEAPRLANDVDAFVAAVG